MWTQRVTTRRKLPQRANYNTFLIYFFLVKTAHERENIQMDTDHFLRQIRAIERIAKYHKSIVSRTPEEWAALNALSPKEQASYERRIERWRNGNLNSEFPEIPGFHRERASVL
jgi:hypothetical protein